MGADERRTVLALALPRVPELSAAAIDAVRAAVPAYRDLREDQLGDVQAIAGWGIARFLQLWAGGGRFGGDDLARFRAIGASRAEDGRPLASVLRSYRVAAAHAADLVLDLGRDHLDADDLRLLLRAVFTFTDDLTEAITSGYAGARERLAGDRGRARRELLDDLLVGRQSSAGARESRSRELELVLPTRVALLVAEAGPGVGPPDLRALEGLCTELGVPPDGHLATVRGARAVLLVDVAAGPRAAGPLTARGWRGCLVRDRPLDGVTGAFRLAGCALDAAPPHAFARGPLLDDGDAHVLALLGGRPDGAPEQVARAVLGGLGTAPHLLDGLGAYLAGGSATGAAERVGVHPQTLRYRLRRIAELTGRDLRDPWHRFVLEVAHHAHRMMS